jgi:prevent-host-death family protein
MDADKNPTKMTLREAARPYRVASPEQAPTAGQARTISVRELKARASELLRELEQTGQEALITRRGTLWGRLVPLARQEKAAGPKRILRNSYRDLPELTEDDFQEAKRLWQPSSEKLN